MRSGVVSLFWDMRSRVEIAWGSWPVLASWIKRFFRVSKLRVFKDWGVDDESFWREGFVEELRDGGRKLRVEGRERLDIMTSNG